MSKAYLGIDSGTSSVKAMVLYDGGKTEIAREEYKEISPDGFIQAVRNAVRKLDVSNVSAIGLTSQVGTYIINEKDVLSWSCGEGRQQLDEIRKRFSDDDFIREISMPHPDILSYPIPRLMYIREKYGENAVVCQPKDMIGRYLTGIYATDMFSWRGLCNIEKGAYSETFLRETGIQNLPEIISPFEKLGSITVNTAEETGLKAGIPVYIGMNDFFASLSGMGLSDADALFDITGTSEHVGVITESLKRDTRLVTGPYLTGYVHYGVTASSGASLKWGESMFGKTQALPCSGAISDSPIFLPYLNGERAPVFDADARGVFFGINANTDAAKMAYSVMEGVVFSAYHIYETLGKPKSGRMIVSGGAADWEALNELKAEMFDLPLSVPREKETSALGAVMAAAVGEGDYPDIACAAKAFCKEEKRYLPKGYRREILMKRYGIYKKLYPTLSESFSCLKEVGK